MEKIGYSEVVRTVALRPSEKVRARREEILRVAGRHGAGNVRLFGSVVRGDAGSYSDVDFLVDVVGATTPWFPGSLVADLEELLELPVQVVIRRSLRRLIADSVLREAIPL